MKFTNFKPKVKEDKEAKPTAKKPKGKKSDSPKKGEAKINEQNCPMYEVKLPIEMPFNVFKPDRVTMQRIVNRYITILPKLKAEEGLLKPLEEFKMP